jgi:hypothetical protein
LHVLLVAPTALEYMLLLQREQSLAYAAPASRPYVCRGQAVHADCADAFA